MSTRSRIAALATCFLVPRIPIAAARTAAAPLTVGDVVVSGAISRTYSWNWFGDTPDGDYTYQGTQVRLGLSQAKKTYDWQLEAEVPFMLHLPTTAVAPAPQGQLGLGAASFAANGNSANPIGLFVKQAFVRFNQLGGIAGQSLRLGRMEFNDGLEVVPKSATLSALTRDRISQRVLGNFGLLCVRPKRNRDANDLSRQPQRACRFPRVADPRLSVSAAVA